MITDEVLNFKTRITQVWGGVSTKEKTAIELTVTACLYYYNMVRLERFERPTARFVVGVMNLNLF